jgi:hypothetical protein
MRIAALGRCRKGWLPVPFLLIAERGAAADGLRAELRVLVLRWAGWRPRWETGLRVASSDGDRLQWRVDGEEAEVCWEDGAVVMRASAPQGPGGRLACVDVRAAGEWAWLAGRHLGVVRGGLQVIGGRAPRARFRGGLARRPGHRRATIDPIAFRRNPLSAALCPTPPDSARLGPTRPDRTPATSGYSAAD